jgi:8-oxo-dGTP pyrophosphatase MutT (NUDIX family)
MDESLLRESHEEAGLTPAHLASRSALLTLQRMHRRLPEGYQVEDVLISECVLPPSVQPVNLDGEVSEFLALTPDEVWPLLCEDQFTLEAELVVLESLRARLSASA